MYAEIVFPNSFRNSFTYIIPKDFKLYAKPGIRALAPFGKRKLTGFIIKIADSVLIDEKKIKTIYDLLDTEPIFNEESLGFYKWMSDYYLSSLGDALKNSTPPGTEIESKKYILPNIELCDLLLREEKNKNSLKAKLLEVLLNKGNSSLEWLQKAVKKKNIYFSLKTLETNGAVEIVEEFKKAKAKPRTLKFIKLLVSKETAADYLPEIEKKYPKQTFALLELIASKEKEISLSYLLKKIEASRSAINSLVKKGLVEIFDKEIERVYSSQFEEDKNNFILTEAQRTTVEFIDKKFNEEKFRVALLHGVTGSGKTQIYIELIRKCLHRGKTALYLVPEISLTPQIIARLKNNFGDLITVLHSRMSYGERYDAWKGILKGKYKIVIGARSALFAPLKNIGLIVVDEEHDSSYKQNDAVPRYNARDSAIMLGKFSNAVVLLGSATPSIESMYNAKSGKYDLLELKERIDGAKMPRIQLINLLYEKKLKRAENAFSAVLLKKLEDRINKKEGAIVLQNRRGFATQIYCEDCGEIESCINCSVGLVYHINKNKVKCHYCEFEKPTPLACSNCGSLSLKFFGVGSQRIEDELEYYFPKAKIRRVDSDSVQKKGRLAEILSEFSRGEADILVGTQIVAKGLDFANVTLVGVALADASLWAPDFRSDEKTFQLLTQVAGRAGRSKKEGEVIIQTYNDKNFTLQKVCDNDYKGFYDRQINERLQFDYPPFTRLALIECKDVKEEKSYGAIKDFHKELLNYSGKLKISSPNPAVISRIRGYYRFQILVKSPKGGDSSGAILRSAILNSFVNFNKNSKFSSVKTIIDIDPQSMM